MPTRICYERCNSSPRGSRRELRLALMASLALNVLIIGAVAGTLCFSPALGTSRTARGLKKSPLLGFAHTLPRERSDMIRQKFADAQPNMEALRKEHSRRARSRCATALMAEPFDQAKFNAALDGVVQAEANEAARQDDAVRRYRRPVDAGGAPTAARLAREKAPPTLDALEGHRRLGARCALRRGRRPAKKSGCTARSSTVTARQPLAAVSISSSDVPCISSSVRARQIASEPALRNAARPLAADRQHDLDELAVGHGHDADAGAGGGARRPPRTAC